MSFEEILTTYINKYPYEDTVYEEEFQNLKDNDEIDADDDFSEFKEEFFIRRENNELDGILKENQNVIKENNKKHIEKYIKYFKENVKSKMVSNEAYTTPSSAFDLSH